MKLLSYLLLAAVITSFDACKPAKKPISVVFTGDAEGRKIYSVIFADGKVMDALYMEEIQYGIKTDNWVYDEDLVLSEIPIVSLSPLD